MNVLKINHFCIDISVLYCSIYLLFRFHPFERISFTLYFEEIEFESPTLICTDSHSNSHSVLHETVRSSVGQTVNHIHFHSKVEALVVGFSSNARTKVKWVVTALYEDHSLNFYWRKIIQIIL